MAETQLTTFALVSHSISGMFSLVPKLPLQLILKGCKISVAEALPCSLSPGIGYYVSLGCCASMLTLGCSCVFRWYMRSSYSCMASSLMVCPPGLLLLLGFRTLENSESQNTIVLCILSASVKFRNTSSCLIGLWKEH